MENTITTRPIIFSTPMVEAILGGRKTVTRRLTHLRDQSVVKAGPKTLAALGHPLIAATVPYPKGDIMWVRETWAQQYGYWHKAGLELDENGYCRDGCFVNDASEPSGKKWIATKAPDKWRPSIHMPKEAARLFLLATDVRVVRLQDISGDLDELEREGINIAVGAAGATAAFADLWDGLRKPADRAKYGWDANPWVWRIAFERCEKPDGWPWRGA